MPEASADRCLRGTQAGLHNAHILRRQTDFEPLICPEHPDDDQRLDHFDRRKQIPASLCADLLLAADGTNEVIERPPPITAVALVDPERSVAPTFQVSLIQSFGVGPPVGSSTRLYRLIAALSIDLIDGPQLVVLVHTLTSRWTATGALMGRAP